MSTPRLKFPLETDRDGRLALVEKDSAAVCQYLGLTRDIAPGEMPGNPELANPLDQVRHGMEWNRLVDSICQVLNELFDRIGKADIRAVPMASEIPDRIKLSNTPATWEVVMQIRRDSSNLILEIPRE